MNTITETPQDSSTTIYIQCLQTFLANCGACIDTEIMTSPHCYERDAYDIHVRGIIGSFSTWYDHEDYAYASGYKILPTFEEFIEMPLKNADINLPADVKDLHYAMFDLARSYDTEFLENVALSDDNHNYFGIYSKKPSTEKAATYLIIKEWAQNNANYFSLEHEIHTDKIFDYKTLENTKFFIPKLQG